MNLRQIPADKHTILTVLGTSNMWLCGIAWFTWSSLIHGSDSELILVTFNKIRNPSGGYIALNFSTFFPVWTEINRVTVDCLWPQY